MALASIIVSLLLKPLIQYNTIDRLGPKLATASDEFKVLRVVQIVVFVVILFVWSLVTLCVLFGKLLNALCGLNVMIPQQNAEIMARQDADVLCRSNCDELYRKNNNTTSRERLTQLKTNTILHLNCRETLITSKEKIGR